MEKKYYIGLDLGTSSVGWAATDENYNFLRLKGKTAWGARIFSEAVDCKGRRSFRSSKRRVARRKYRLLLLKNLFAEEMAKVDKTFFLRLENSTYWAEDKAKDAEGNDLGKTLIFKTTEEEREFHKTYPTTWHLRKKLVDNDEQALSDLRLVYLAIHHIMKYRGNFLSDGTKDNEEPSKDTIDRINVILNLLEAKDNESGVSDNITYLSKESYNELIETLENKNLNKTKKQDKIKKLFKNIDKTNEDIKVYIDLFKTLVTGGVFSVKKINEEYDKLKIDFNNGFDDNADEISKALGDAYELVLIAKAYNDYISLKDLLGGNPYLSYVMADIYDEHKKDLRSLKEILISIDNKLGNEGSNRVYNLVFKPVIVPKEERKDKDGKKNKKLTTPNYASFIQGDDVEKKSVTLENLNKNIKEILEANKQYVDEIDKEEFDRLLDKASNNELFKKQATVSTSLIPHQCHLKELNKILENAGEKYPFIKENSDKIIQLFKFRVPYYYGPLNNESKEHAWIVKNEGKERTKITPWNIDEVVDKGRTREGFFKKLTNSCTYLVGETVLPKVSLVYEKYLALERLNKMQVNGNYLNHKDKIDLLNYVLGNSNTTIENIRKKLASDTGMKINDIVISNIKNNVPFTATSHAFFRKRFNLENSKEFELCEEVIKYATIYADDKKELKKFLSENFSFDEKLIKEIANLQTNKLGRLSKKFLCGGAKDEMYYTDENGVMYTILGLLEETNQNLQEIVNSGKYGFDEKIKEFNDALTKDETIDEQISKILEGTPALMVRSITQTMKVVDDVIKAAKCEPKKIIMEVTRTDEKKGQEVASRYIQLKKKISEDKEIDDKEKEGLLSDLEEANKTKKLKGKHLYLYFSQLGIDLYTGKKMKIEEVLEGKYDIDHIVPQSLIKDDSLDNQVLVNKKYNQDVKKDIYPICDEIRSKMLNLWYNYKERGIIKEEKYNRLIRTTDLTDDEINDFVRRQINVVNYSNVQIKRIFELKYPDTEIIFSKAGFPSLLRKEYEIAKMRDLNDAHHAVDAYLNIVCGDILTSLYTDVFYLIKRKKEKKENPTFNMERRLLGYIKKNDLMNKIKSNCLRHDALITFKPDYDSGMFYKQTIFKKSGDKETGLIPLHTKGPMSDVKKYGGYSSLSQSYILAVEYKVKKKTVKKLLRVPTMYVKLYGDDLNKIAKLIVDDEKATDIKVLRKIYLNQKIKYNGCYYLIYTKNEFVNKYKMAYQNYIDNDALVYLNKCLKKTDELDDKDKTEQEIIVNKDGDKLKITKEENLKIFKLIKEQYSKPVYESTPYIAKSKEMPEDAFNNLSIKKQIDTLFNMIKILSRSNEDAKFDKSLNNGSSKYFLKVNTITDDKIYIVNESPSGLFKGKEELI